MGSKPPARTPGRRGEGETQPARPRRNLSRWDPTPSARPKPRAPLPGSRLLRFSRRKWLCHYFVGASWGGGPLGCPRHLGTRFCGTEKSHPASGTASGSALTKSLSAPSVPGGPAPPPLRPQAEHGSPTTPHPIPLQVNSAKISGGGGTQHCPDLPWGPPRTPRSARASLASLPPPSSPSPASRGPRIPGRVPLTPAAESRLLRGPGSERRREVTAPPSDRERGRRRGSGALTPPPAPIYPRQPKIPRAPAANPRNAPSGAERHFPACCSPEGTRRPALLPAPTLGGADWGPPEQLCTDPLSPRRPPETPPYPSRGTRMERRFPGSKRDHHRPGGRPRPTPESQTGGL